MTRSAPEASAGQAENFVEMASALLDVGPLAPLFCGKFDLDVCEVDEAEQDYFPEILEFLSIADDDVGCECEAAGEQEEHLKGVAGDGANLKAAGVQVGLCRLEGTTAGNSQDPHVERFACKTSERACPAEVADGITSGGAGGSGFDGVAKFECCEYQDMLAM